MYAEHFEEWLEIVRKLIITIQLTNLIKYTIARLTTKPPQVHQL